VVAGTVSEKKRYFAGVMTGTSLDGIDVAILEIGSQVTLGHVRPTLALAHFFSRPMDRSLVDALMSLQSPSENELHRAALIANSFSDSIARTVLEALTSHGIPRRAIDAIGVHGQTVRHQPQLGYSIQLNTPARIAEITGITVVSDFRSRDIAAGGQGAPLVPAFHQAIFQSESEHRAVINIGGIANISWLAQPTLGYDTGPGNLLMDYWIRRHQGHDYDNNGLWASTGNLHMPLLHAMLSDPFFSVEPPRSTGRDLFSENWLNNFLSQARFANLQAHDVQATLLHLTARSIALEIQRLERSVVGGKKRQCDRLLVCGGGARNGHLLEAIRHQLAAILERAIPVESTEFLGWDPQVIEAAAFAWLASRTLDGLTGNTPSVTGAIGERVLGTITPA
jgi:anhydro-N-acetylmuramic acid kinase